MIVSIEDILEYYQEEHQSELCSGCEQKGRMLFEPDWVSEGESVCDECTLSKNADGEYQMCRFYDGGM